MSHTLLDIIIIICSSYCISKLFGFRCQLIIRYGIRNRSRNIIEFLLSLILPTVWSKHGMVIISSTRWGFDIFLKYNCNPKVTINYDVIFWYTWSIHGHSFTNCSVIFVNGKSFPPVKKSNIQCIMNTHELWMHIIILYLTCMHFLNSGCFYKLYIVNLCF